MNKKRRLSRRSAWIGTLLFIGFCAMEFPGVLFFAGRIRPFIFGMPFIYGYILCCWSYMCLVFWYAYKYDWGREREPDSSGLSQADDD